MDVILNNNIMKTLNLIELNCRSQPGDSGPIVIQRRCRETGHGLAYEDIAVNW